MCKLHRGKCPLAWALWHLHHLLQVLTSVTRPTKTRSRDREQSFGW